MEINELREAEAESRKAYLKAQRLADKLKAKSDAAAAERTRLGAKWRSLSEELDRLA